LVMLVGSWWLSYRRDNLGRECPGLLLVVEWRELGFWRTWVRGVLVSERDG
jgi:hypothetical protein